MRARHLLLVLLGAAALSACAAVPAPTRPQRGPHPDLGVAVRPAAAAVHRPRPTAHGPVAGPSAPTTPAPPVVPAAYRAACAAAGGAIAVTTGAEWAPGVCVVTYPGEGTFPATIDRGGAFDPVWAQRNQTDCGLLAYDAALDAAAHRPWRQLPLYHPASGACFPGQIG